MYSGPREIELLNMLLAGGETEETVAAPGVAADAAATDAHKSPFAPAADDEDDDDSDSVDATRADAERAVGLSTLSGARGTINFRTYLEPSSKTAPLPSTLVRDRILAFKRR